jgi:hypothetical protein
LDRFKLGYDRLFEKWLKEKKPPRFREGQNEYVTVWEHERSEQFPKLPAFHHNHGILMLPYALEVYKDKTPITIVLGGFGSGKSINCGVLPLLIDAITLPEYRAFVLGPYSNQSAEIYKIALKVMTNTPFADRFLIKAVEKPYPKLVIGHDGVGENTIECYPIADEEALRNLTGDVAIIEQAEHAALDLDEIIRSVGTRLRGRTLQHGRPKKGKMLFIANAGDNQRLWDLVDRAEEEPEMFKALQPSTYDNPYLTEADIKRFEVQVGDNQELRDQYLKGKRPLGNGQHFSRTTLEAMREPRLDDMMKYGLLEQDSTGIHRGYSKQEARGVGVWEWMLPYQEGRTYIQISDPGTKNPPHRDSPPIMIWDVTDFPKEPAHMAVFRWVFGHNNIKNWANNYQSLAFQYRTFGQNAFDATGYQSGYDQWMFTLDGIMPEKINLAGNGKSLALNSAKVVTTQGLIKAPIAVSALFEQLSRYEYPPEPKHLRQDLVMCFIMTCWYLQRLFYMLPDSEMQRPGYDPNDRYYRPEPDRYGSHIR